LAVTHGAYASSLRLSGRADELAAELREVAPVCTPADEVTVRLLATTLVRVERATAALDQLDQTAEGRELSPYVVEEAAKLQRLREDLRGWISMARRLAADLGMTPSARAKLGLDVALTRRALTLADLHAAAAAEVGADGPDVAMADELQQ
jgi:hypothetical protein